MKAHGFLNFKNIAASCGTFQKQKRHDWHGTEVNLPACRPTWLPSTDSQGLPCPVPGRVLADHPMQVRETEHLTTSDSEIKRHHQPVPRGPRGAAIGKRVAHRVVAEVSPFLLALGTAFG